MMVIQGEGQDSFGLILKFIKNKVEIFPIYYSWWSVGRVWDLTTSLNVLTVKAYNCNNVYFGPDLPREVEDREVEDRFFA